MFGHYPVRDSLQIQPMQYSSFEDTQRSEKISTCMIVGLVVVGVLFFATMQKPKTRPRARFAAHDPRMYVSGMLAAVQSISGRIASLSPVSGVLDASKVFTQIPSGSVSLIDCPKAVKDPEAWKNYTPGEKNDCEKKAREWLTKHPEAVIMVFAPWCGHCHKAMPLFAELATSSQLPFLMINAEAMPRTALSGESAIYPCQHFPTFLAKSGDHFKAADGPRQAAEMVAQRRANSDTPPPSAAAPPSLAAPAAASDDDIFAMLF